MVWSQKWLKVWVFWQIWAKTHTLSPFLGLATCTKVDSLKFIKISNYPFIKFCVSQNLGPWDLRNLVEALREPKYLNKVLCKPANELSEQASESPTATI